MPQSHVHLISELARLIPRTALILHAGIYSFKKYITEAIKKYNII